MRLGKNKQLDRGKRGVESTKWQKQMDSLTTVMIFDTIDPLFRFLIQWNPAPRHPPIRHCPPIRLLLEIMFCSTFYIGYKAFSL